MLRMYLLQHAFNLADESREVTMLDSAALRRSHAGTEYSFVLCGDQMAICENVERNSGCDQRLLSPVPVPYAAVHDNPTSSTSRMALVDCATAGLDSEAGAVMDGGLPPMEIAHDGRIVAACPPAFGLSVPGVPILSMPSMRWVRRLRRVIPSTRAAIIVRLISLSGIRA